MGSSIRESCTILLAISWACWLALAAGCSKAPPPAPPKVADVTAITIAPRDTPAAYEFVGQTQSSREVEIRARVEGFLEKRVYTEGDLVKTGQTLFVMDQKPFQASLQQARGELAQQQARLQVAEANLARVKPLAEQNAVSRKDLDDAVGNEKSARAAVLTAEGSVRQAELNLSYTTIMSPLTGLSSFAKIQDGAYVNASNNLLTTVSQLDPMWVNFSISENELLRVRADVSKGQIKLPAGSSFEIEVVLGDGSVFPSRGRISFADPSYSKETGTFLVRATFANPKGTLRPGQFVRVNVLGASRPNAILVPQRAVQQGAKSHFVWVVGKDGKAEQRVVETGEWSGDDWVITQGLLAGDQVVVDGAIRVSPGAELKVTPLKPSPASAATQTIKTADPLSVETASKRGPQAAPTKPREKTDARPDAKPEPKPGASLPATVHFAFRDATLDAAAAARVAGLARALKDGKAELQVTGYADGRGTPERNAKFAEERARAVRDALVAGGITAERIRLVKPERVTGDGTPEQARRVDITTGSAG